MNLNAAFFLFQRKTVQIGLSTFQSTYHLSGILNPL